MFNRIGTWFRRQSVARKLTTTALTTSGVTLMAACTVFATYDYINLRSRLVRDVTMLADVVGTNSTAALTFKDAAAATQTLRAAAANDTSSARGCSPGTARCSRPTCARAPRGAPSCRRRSPRRASKGSPCSRETTCASSGRFR